MCGVSHLRQSYASLWHNPAVLIGEKSVYWNQCLTKGIYKVSDLYLDGIFLSFSDLVQKYDLEYRGNFWKYLQIRNCITKGRFIQDKNPVLALLDLPGTVHKAAVFYKALNGLQKNICKNLRLIWQKDLNCELNDEVWSKILANTGKYVKEARGGIYSV